MKKTTDKLMILFFVAWFLCGCSVDTMLDDWRSCIAAIMALIVAIVVAAMLGWRKE